MDAHWIEITQAGKKTRHGLSSAGLCVGGPGAAVQIAGLGAGQLSFEADPWRVSYTGPEPAPYCAGQPVGELLLRAGAQLDWAGIRIQYNEALLLEELPTPELGATLEAFPSPGEQQAWLRLRAGLLVDLGLADRRTVKRWQKEVLGGQLDHDLCAREINQGVLRGDGRLADRAGRLMRDFLMASKLKGLSGAARGTRGAVRSFFSMLIAQFVAIGIYSLILMGCMIFIHRGGTSFDALFDAILGFFQGN